MTQVKLFLKANVGFVVGVLLGLLLGYTLDEGSIERVLSYLLNLLIGDQAPTNNTLSIAALGLLIPSTLRRKKNLSKQRLNQLTELTCRWYRDFLFQYVSHEGYLGDVNDHINKSISFSVYRMVNDRIRILIDCMVKNHVRQAYAEGLYVRQLRKVLKAMASAYLSHDWQSYIVGARNRKPARCGTNS